MSLITAVVAFLVVLGPVVFFHELGHFLLAKLAGIRVIEFGLGYPPRIWKFWQSAGRTTIAGMRLVIPKNFKAPLPQKDIERLFKRPDKADKSAGFGWLDNLLLRGDVMDVIEIVKEEERFAEATVVLQPDGSRVLQSITLLNPSTDDVTSAQTPTLARGQVTDHVPGTAYSLNWLPVGGFTRMLGEEDPTAPDSFAAAPKRWRSLVLLAGPGMNLVLAIIVFISMFVSGVPEPRGLRVFIGSVQPGAPADVAGLKPGDLVLAVNGQETETTAQVSAITRANLGKEIALSIRRGQDEFDVRATPRRAAEFDPTKEGPLGITIGMTATLGWGLRYYSPLEAVPLGLGQTVMVVGNVVFVPVAIIRGLIPAALARPVGPVGIAQLAGVQVEESIHLGGLYPILNLAGFLSIAIGLTNLLPLPALDGGRLVFILVEAVRRRRVDPKKEAIVHLIGLAFLLTLMLVFTLQDIINPIDIPRFF